MTNDEAATIARQIGKLSGFRDAHAGLRIDLMIKRKATQDDLEKASDPLIRRVFAAQVACNVIDIDAQDRILAVLDHAIADAFRLLASAVTETPSASPSSDAQAVAAVSGQR